MVCAANEVHCEWSSRLRVLEVLRDVSAHTSRNALLRPLASSVVQAWANLPQAVRVGLVAMAKAADASW